MKKTKKTINEATLKKIIAESIKKVMLKEEFFNKPSDEEYGEDDEHMKLMDGIATVNGKDVKLTYDNFCDVINSCDYAQENGVSEALMAAAETKGSDNKEADWQHIALIRFDDKYAFCGENLDYTIYLLGDRFFDKISDFNDEGIATVLDGGRKLHMNIDGEILEEQ